MQALPRKLSFGHQQPADTPDAPGAAPDKHTHTRTHTHTHEVFTIAQHPKLTKTIKHMAGRTLRIAGDSQRLTPCQAAFTFPEFTRPPLYLAYLSPLPVIRGSG